MRLKTIEHVVVQAWWCGDLGIPGVVSLTVLLSLRNMEVFILGLSALHGTDRVLLSPSRVLARSCQLKQTMLSQWQQRPPEQHAPASCRTSVRKNREVEGTMVMPEK